MEIINCKDFVANWKNEIKKDISILECSPVLNIIQVGDNPASNSYIKGKLKDCEEVGIKVNLYKFDENINANDLYYQIETIQEQNYAGIIVQLPLPSHIDVNIINQIIIPQYDVDGFVLNSPYISCTPLGVLTLLKQTVKEKWNQTLDGQDVTIIGRSDIVGKPMAKLLIDNNCTVTLCHSHTKDYKKYTKNSDIVIVAVGKSNFLKAEDITPHTIVIDVGINMVDGHLVGDVNRQSFIDADYDDVYLTPVPSGVGLLTRCALLHNVIEIGKRLYF